MSASSYRVASRIVNSLRAGRPVRSHEGLAGSQLVLIMVPEARLAATLIDLSAAAVDWRGKALVLCDSHHDSSALVVFSTRGAAVASLNLIEGFEEQRFVAKGDRPALRALRNLIKDGRTQVFNLLPSTKALYSAGITFATSMSVSLIDAARECLHGAGLPAAAIPAIVSRLIEKMLRAYLKAGRKSWNGLIGGGDFDALRGQLEAVSGLDARLGRYFRAAALLAGERLGRNTQWSAAVASLAGGGAAPVRKISASTAGDGSAHSP